MDYEKQLLSVRVSNLETFMEAVCKRLKCLPDYNDSLPTKGNSHVINKLDALLKDVESPNSATGQPEKVSLPCAMVPCPHWIDKGCCEPVRRCGDVPCLMPVPAQHQ
jgi:hypothetical protein